MANATSAEWLNIWGIGAVPIPMLAMAWKGKKTTVCFTPPASSRTPRRAAADVVKESGQSFIVWYRARTTGFLPNRGLGPC